MPRLLQASIILIIGLIIGALVYSVFGPKSQPSTQAGSAQVNTKYPFLEPQAPKDEADLLINFTQLRKNLKDQATPYNDSFSFYFEYLPTGTSIGFNEKTPLYAASLVKVPLVMAFYKLDTDQKVDIDNTKVKITEDEIDSGFGDLYKKGVGYELTLREVTRLALVDSDNTAARILGKLVPYDNFKEIYSGLDLDLNIEKGETLISTKSYASILKALYFSSILKREDSNQILDLLTQTKFDDKLRAPIPSDILVAHKIGVYKNEYYQDCGIVYLPKRPYVLCMISKSSEDEARSRMNKVSDMIYKFIQSR